MSNENLSNNLNLDLITAENLSFGPKGLERFLVHGEGTNPGKYREYLLSLFPEFQSEQFEVENKENLEYFVSQIEKLYLNSVTVSILAERSPDKIADIPLDRRKGESMYLRDTESILNALKNRANESSPDAKKVVVACGSMIRLAQAFMIEQGIPAITTVGFAGYFPISEKLSSAGVQFIGHWTLKFYDPSQGWRILDIDGKRALNGYNKRNGTNIDFTNLQESELFVPASRALRSVMTGEQQAEKFYVGYPTPVYGMEGIVRQFGSEFGHAVGIQPPYGVELKSPNFYVLNQVAELLEQPPEESLSEIIEIYSKNRESFVYADTIA